MMRKTVILFGICLVWHSAIAAEPSLAGYRLGMSLQDVQSTGQGKECDASDNGGIACAGGQVQIGSANLWANFDVIDGRVWRITATGRADEAGTVRRDFSSRYGQPEIVPVTSKVLNSAGVTGAFRWTGANTFLTVTTTDGMLFVMLAPISK
jgi:hypothetical protein